VRHVRTGWNPFHLGEKQERKEERKEGSQDGREGRRRRRRRKESSPFRFQGTAGVLEKGGGDRNPERTGPEI